MTDALVLATEAAIRYDSWLARTAVPIGIIIFLGGPYMLLRSNLGTLRAYLVLATSFFGFMMLISLFWAFGAPGTPAATGPTNLPGQPPDEYQPVWVPFAADSTIAEDPDYVAVVGDDAAFGPVPADQAENVGVGAGEIKNLFSTDPETSGYPIRIPGTWVLDGDPGYAVADNGRPVIRVTYAATYALDAQGNPPEGVSEDQIGTLIPAAEREEDQQYTAYAFFDAGAPLFPSLMFVLTSLLGFALHGALLYRDEQSERREREPAAVEPERVPAAV